jgi:hypothetical protein
MFSDDRIFSEDQSSQLSASHVGPIGAKKPASKLTAVILPYPAIFENQSP